MIEKALIAAILMAAILIGANALLEASQMGSIGDLWDCLNSGWSPEACGL